MICSKCGLRQEYRDCTDRERKYGMCEKCIRENIKNDVIYLEKELDAVIEEGLKLKWLSREVGIMMDWNNRYENKYGRVYDTFKNQYITFEIDKESCDNIVSHLNSHCRTIVRLIKNGRYLFENNNKLKEEIEKFKIENEA